jgi:hypothetical protein
MEAEAVLVRLSKIGGKFLASRLPYLDNVRDRRHENTRKEVTNTESVQSTTNEPLLTKYN